MGVGGLEAHGICNSRLVYREVVEAQSGYKKSYLWQFRNIACGDSTGINQIEKDKVCIPPGLVWEKEGRRRGGVILYVCVCIFR